VLSAASVSDALLYLVLQRELAFDPAWLPLLYVGTPLFYFAMAGPAGMLADRRGAAGTFIAGHVCLLLAYALLALAPAGPVLLGGTLLLLGAYYAATDGVLAAMASAVLPGHVRATGLSVLATGTTLARAGAAVAFGALWTYRGRGMALAIFGLALLFAMVVGGVLLARAGHTRPPHRAKAVA
jgi:MFS family permease